MSTLRELGPGSPTPNVGVWTGGAAIAVAALTVLEFTIRTIAVGQRPGLDDAEALLEFSRRTAAGTLGVVLTDTFLMAVLIVFLACFRQLVVQVRADVRWIADIAFGAGLVYVAVTLVGDGLEAGVALDTTAPGASAETFRTLTVAHALLFGSIGCVLTALVAAASGFITLVSVALPRWTGWLALVVAVSNLVAVGLAFGGTDDGSFHAAGGWGSVALGTGPWLVWVVVVGVVVIRDRRGHHSRARSMRRRPAAA